MQMRMHFLAAMIFGIGSASAYDPSHLNRFYQEGMCIGCNLIGAYFQGQDLTDKNLAGANLSYANLQGAILNNTNLAGANLSGATWVDGTVCREGSIGYCLR